MKKPTNNDAKRQMWMGLIVVLGLLAGAPALAAEPKLTLLFTGDNEGEIAQCGCRTNPAGGLARRKLVVDKARAVGPVLLLDAGNALFKGDRPADDGARKRATLVLRTMADLGTAASVPGAKDLVGGLDFLRQGAKQAGLKLLSANLETRGKRIFPASTVVSAGGLKVGLVGVSPAGHFGGAPQVNGAPPLPALLAEAKALRPKVDVVVVLAAVPLEEARLLSREAGSNVDLILQSHEARNVRFAERPGDGNYLVPTGHRGRNVGRMELFVAGPGAFVDQAERERGKQSLALAEANLTRVQAQLASSKDPSARASLEKSRQEIEGRKRALVESLNAEPAARSFNLSFIELTPDLEEDPALKAKVAAIPPSELQKPD